MSETPMEHSTYMISTSDDEYTRLAKVAEAMAVHVRDGCRRVGVPAGASAVEVGCGAPGALLALAEVVGPQGRIVGIDLNAETVAKAQEIVRRHNLPNVSVIQADLDTLDPESICPPEKFDLAFCRLFLEHQRDVATTLRRMAALVRTGGHLLIQEPLLSTHLAEPPLVEPASPAFREYFRMVTDLHRRAGGQPEIAQYMDEALLAAGLKPIGQHLFSVGTGPHYVTPLAQSLIRVLTGYRPSLVAYQVATEAEIDALVHGLTEAQAQAYRTFFLPLFAEAIARVP